MQARFWVMVRSDATRIKLNPGESVRHYYSESTDEGWNSTTTVFAYDGQTVTYQDATDGRDCDGRMQRYGESSCPVADLAAGYHEKESGVTYPKWSEGKTSQRDHSAERMGY